MITKDRLKSILAEGRKLQSQKYYDHCRTNHIKTFYFFCERLSSQSPGVALSSKELNDYIIEQLGHRQVVVNKQFNPQGWFGQAWTDWHDPAKSETNFKSEYADVLDRLGNDPYSYRIKPEYLDDVIQVFRELAAGT